MKRHLLSIVLMLVAFGIDRVHKYVQIEALGWTGGEVMPVTSFFDYVLVWNTGISYGLLNAMPLWGLGILIAAAVIGLGIWWWRADTALVRAGLAIAIGGALSNAFDRWRYGAVADFFHFHLGEWSFYIFNLADVAITVGVGLLILDFLGVGRRRAA